MGCRSCGIGSRVVVRQSAGLAWLFEGCGDDLRPRMGPINRQDPPVGIEMIGTRAANIGNPSAYRSDCGWFDLPVCHGSDVIWGQSVIYDSIVVPGNFCGTH